MASVDVYQHPSNSYTVAVPPGFNVAAFFFGGFWLLAKGMGLWFLFWILLVIVLGYISFGLLVVPMWIGLGFVANQLHRRHLLQQGYRLIGQSEVPKMKAGRLYLRKPDTPLPELPVKKCPQCAEEVKREAVVCRFCGHRFDGQPATAPAQPPAPPPAAVPPLVSEQRGSTGTSPFTKRPPNPSGPPNR